MFYGWNLTVGCPLISALSKMVVEESNTTFPDSCLSFPSLEFSIFLEDFQLTKSRYSHLIAVLTI